MRQEPCVVIYDGLCNFCNGAVRFIIKHDPHQRFVFAPLQSDYAQQLILAHGVDTAGTDTFMLVKEKQVFVWSNAALEITKDLSGYWHWFYCLKIIPAPVRDFFYKWFARNRIRLFGGTSHCQIPSAETLKRFRGIDTQSFSEKE